MGQDLGRSCLGTAKPRLGTEVPLTVWYRLGFWASALLLELRLRCEESRRVMDPIWILEQDGLGSKGLPMCSWDHMEERAFGTEARSDESSPLVRC